MKTENTIMKLKVQTKVIRKRRYVVSRLDKYKGELLTLYKNGVTIAELQRWLRKRKIKVVYSTVYRWLQKHG